MKKKLRFEEFSETEKQETIELFKSSREYNEGELPFAYQYVFPGGKTLKASQDEEGLGHVIIVENGKVIVDFLSLAPPDTKFITPTYFEKHPDDEVGKTFFRNYGGWGMHFLEKKVFCGEFKNPRQILGLLHELGHLQKNTVEEFEYRQRLINFTPASDSPEIHQKQIIAANKEFAKLESKIEREAWAWALAAVRKMSRETSVDFLQVFPKFQDMKNYIRDCLRAYRYSHEWIIKKSFDEDFYKEMEKLFDRWKYSSAAKE